MSFIKILEIIFSGYRKKVDYESTFVSNHIETRSLPRNVPGTEANIIKSRSLFSIKWPLGRCILLTILYDYFLCLALFVFMLSFVISYFTSNFLLKSFSNVI